MKRYVCPQCGANAPVRLYGKPGAKLMCFQCTTPGNPVYVEVEEEAPRGKGVQATHRRSA